MGRRTVEDESGALQRRTGLGAQVRRHDHIDVRHRAGGWIRPDPVGQLGAFHRCTGHADPVQRGQDCPDHGSEPLDTCGNLATLLVEVRLQLDVEVGGGHFGCEGCQAGCEPGPL